MASNKLDAFIVIGIVLGSALLGVGAYQYYSSAAERIRQSSVDEIKRNTEVIGHTIALSVKNKLETVTSNLQILAGSPAMNAKWLDRGLVLLTAAQSSTDSFTDEYIWADENGAVLQSASNSKGNPDKEGAVGVSVDSADYFRIPKETSEPYLAGFSKGTDGVGRLYLSYPIIGPSGNSTNDLNPSLADQPAANSFKGIVVASIELQPLSALVTESSSASVNTVSRILDKNGVVLVNERIPEFVGKNWFGDEIQSDYYPNLVPIEQKDAFNRFNHDAANSQTPASIDINFEGAPSTVVSNPIVILDVQVMTLFTRASHTLPATTLAVIEEQRAISTIVIVGIIAAAAIASFTLLSWNKKLQSLVKKRTLELEAKTQTLNEANEKLINADKMQKEFINIAAHELRTPTQAIMAYTEALQDDSIPSSPEDYEAIARNAKRLQRLTEDILDVTRIEAGNLTLRREKFFVDEVINSAIKDAKSQQPNSTLPFVYEPKGLVIEADRDRLSQVIYNLLTNAVKFTKEGNVTISTIMVPNLENGDGWQDLIIAVSDTGTGIDADIFPRLFSKFATKSEKGTGLGLFIAKSIAEAHGGTVTARNNETKGATFSLRIPMPKETSTTMYTNQISETKAL
ncbi:MAG TPA: sensor histidine kinase [Nitrososphaera sp.]|jgi:signal transduction histidine kinase|nr:sensor histidine kinase [Nitrososphaera sp.]